MAFPQNFIFGCATSAYQIEGAWNTDGKGENIWDRLARDHPEFIDDRSNGNIACDSYHKYKEDIFHLKDIGFDMYRFSISWTRILPTGDIANINEVGLQHYDSLIDELLKNNIIPMITMYHFDLPQKLQDMGGWLNPLIVDYFEDYADLLFKRYGDKVKWWITLNEPKFIIPGYVTGKSAPSLRLDSPANYIIAHNCLKAHGRIFRLYEKKYKIQQRGKISIALPSDGFFPRTFSKDDVEAADRATLFTLDWFAHPIYSKDGDYPEVMRQMIDINSKNEGRNRSRLPQFTAEEIRDIKGSFDFFALNHYSSYLCSPGYKLDRNRGFINQDMNVKLEFAASWPYTNTAWQRVWPEGFRQILVWIKNQYDNVPVFITENGVSVSGNLNDTFRESYHHSYLQQLLFAMKEDKCNVIGYTAYSLLDAFEWTHGYKPRYGIVHVDFTDPERKRTQKRSASYFKQLLKTRDLSKIETKN
ncbi:hypothetical protein V9T40_000783 [Parthenolecanium corni]|uniref:beta-glucosidase n=1 Tax=Parthenolecanium corni TaxID=536013 RepID=A0AAN9Y0S5_9HEMI